MSMLAESLKIPGQSKVPLVIGGIGTESAIPYIRSLLRLNPDAKRDQDHLGYLMLVASSLPDRTEAIEKKNQGDRTQYDEIAKRIIDYAEFGKNNGFSFFVTLCNTIHIFREDSELDIQAKLPIPWISIMESAAEDMKNSLAPDTKIAILGTNRTLQSKIYHAALTKVGLTPISPEVDSDVQKGVMEAIYNETYGIKAKGSTPQATELFLKAARWAEEQQADVILSACTEIPLGLHEETYKGKLKLLNPLYSLAKKTLSLALG